MGRNSIGIKCVTYTAMEAKPMPKIKETTQVLVVLFVAVALSVLTFHVINLAFDLFIPLVGYSLNIAIIVGFSFIIWKLRLELYDYLHFRN